MGKLDSYNHMVGNSWNLKLDKSRAMELYLLECTDTYIANALMVSIATICNWRNCNNLHRNIKGKKDRDVLVATIDYLCSQGLNDREIAEELKCSSKKVTYVRTKVLKKQNNMHYKRDVYLSEFEYQVLIGTSIADGHLSSNDKNTKARISFAHSMAQEKYALHKAEILNKFSIATKYYSSNDKRTNKVYSKVSISSKYYKEIYDLYKKLYVNKVKAPSKELVQELGPIAFAYIYMDDGYYLRGGAGISFCSFPEEINKLFVSRLQEFGVISTIHKNGVIYISRNSFDTFKNLILPYIHEELLYKLNM